MGEEADRALESFLLDDYEDDYEYEIYRRPRKDKESGPGPCPICNDITVIRTGPYGTFYGCINFPECNGNRDGDGRPDKSSGPGICPQCGSETRIRNGKHGPFYGCITYPKCKGKRKYNGKHNRSVIQSDQQICSKHQ